jgi:hypothetical protein
MNPYPYKDTDRMAHLVLQDKAGNKHWPGLNGPQIRQIRQARSIESVVGEDEWNLTTTDEDLPEAEPMCCGWCSRPPRSASGAAWPPALS